MSILDSRPFSLVNVSRAELGRATVAAALVLLAFAAAVSVIWATIHALGPQGGRDTQWSGAHVLLMGIDPSRLFIACRLTGCASDPFLLYQNPNYPVSALMTLLPLGALPWPAARLVWAGVNLASVAILFWCARRDLAPEIDRRVLIVGFLCFLISTPFRNHVENGQTGLYALAMFALAHHAARRARPGIAGLLLALAWVKFTLTLPLSLVFVARRDWRVIAIAIATHILLTLAAAWWTDTDLFASTFGFIGVARLAVHEAYGYLDLFAITNRLGLPWALATIPAVTLAGAGLFLASNLGRGSELLLISVAALLAMAVFYHLSYDGVILLCRLLFALRVLEERPANVARLAFVSLILLAVAMSWFGNRLIQGSEAGYIWGSPGYRAFYWLMAANFYAALVAGLYQLRKMRTNLTWAESVAMSRGSLPTK